MAYTLHWFNPQPTLPISIAVNESEMMDYHHSFHLAITAQEAEKRLRKCGNHCYLTRYSEIRQCYMLSVYQKAAMKHYEITFKHFSHHKEYLIKGKTLVFGGLENMLAYYENNAMDSSLNNIGKPVTIDDYMTKGMCVIL